MPPALRALGCDEAAVGQLEALAALLAANGVLKSVNIDFSVLSDMKYYNGVTFQGFVRGVPAGVISGGQYDRLLDRMGRKGRAIGFACYLDALARLEKPERRLDADTVLLYDRDDDPLRVAAAVRALGEEGGSVLAPAPAGSSVDVRVVMG